MGFFSQHPGGTLSDLALHSGRDKAQLARLVKGLRERSLLIGEPDPDDRRNVHLRLSDAGIAIQQALRSGAQALNARAVDGLSATEQATLADLPEAREDQPRRSALAAWRPRSRARERGRASKHKLTSQHRSEYCEK